jgi:16S rRNA (cytosine967-C5)-methyltransferase
VQALQAQQALILDSAARLLKPGGRLVYATCSLLSAENQAIAGQFSAAHAGEFTELPARVALAAAHVEMADTLVDGNFLRLWPHRHSTDGFFAAAWTRS